MALYVYALVAGAPGRRVRGLAREPLRLVRCRGMHAVVGELTDAPRVNEATLRAHDAAVRRLVRVSAAVLPVRFGTVLDDDAALARALAPRCGELRRALALVAGRDQMTLRVYAERPALAENADEPPVPTLGPGARYLAARLRAGRRARAVPEIDWLRSSIAPLIHAERLERHEEPPLVATVHHLIARSDALAYFAALQSVGTRLAGVHVVPSGPLPAYAFAPETVR
jgi:gas vesicle protein GvpL/GvpF